MKKGIVLLNILAVISGLLISCKSLPQKNECIVYVMVYDYSSNALKDVDVSLDDKFIGKTDVYGRFFIQLEDEESMHLLNIAKEDYESLSVCEEMEDQKVYYFKIGSGSYYAQMAEKYMDQKDYVNADSFIEKALSINPQRKDYLYLSKIIKEGKR